LQIAGRLGYGATPTNTKACIDEVFAMLTGLMNALQAREAAR
jgi:hypothetical protein